MLHDTEIFCGVTMPPYTLVNDNPYVMLRLAKALAHAAQWIESSLTAMQKLLPAGTITGATLSKKLGSDPAFAPLVTAAGSEQQFSGNCPKAPIDVEIEIRQLLSDLKLQTAEDHKDWRVLRLLYIVRNATAHEINDGLAFYTDRKLLLELLHVTFLSRFVIERRKLGAAP